MTSRKRKNFIKFLSKPESGSSRKASRSSKPAAHSRLRRQHLLETLESRQLLAGPQLIGVQPNEGDLIVNGTVRDTAPRVLTFRFDENQIIDPATVSGIQISRAGSDGQLGTTDDVRINPGLVTLGDNASNEVVVRFADSLVDDNYRIEVYGFDDVGRGIVGLRNVSGELLIPRTAGQRSEVIDFELDLGALIEAVVPQPVVRASDGTLSQNRNEIVVYFNQDPLFVENDPTTGQPTARSAENPRFYQLLLTQDSVRTTDDVLFFPQRVVYDANTHTARLFFAGDINNLPGVPQGGGTFRLRVGTAVDTRTDLILPPNRVPVAPSLVEDFDRTGFRVRFESRLAGEAASGQRIVFERVGGGPATVRLEPNGTIVFNLGGGPVSAQDLRTAVTAVPAVAALIDVTWELNGVPGAGGGTLVPSRLVGGSALVLQAAGDTLGTSFDVGVFGLNGGLVSRVFSESIDPQPFNIELLGGNDDPGHRQLPEIAGGGLVQHLNSLFGDNGADITNGVSAISYNFQGVFATAGNNSFLNQINERQKTRIREALNLWSSAIGVQFRETVDEGITFALGNPNDLPAVTDTQLVSFPVLNAVVRIDPTFNESAIVFSNQFAFNTAYGEDFLRKATAGIGMLLGLEQTPELAAQTLMNLNGAFLNNTINTNPALEPVFPGNYDVLHGQYLYRPDSIDVDMYRFEVNLNDANRTGKLTAETFAERLPDASSLDTTLTLFKQQDASFVTDFNVGTSLSVRFDALAEGRLGNNVRIDFFRSDRPTGDDAIRISQPLDNSGNPIPNGILVDMPRRGTLVPNVPVGDIVNAINSDAYASTVVRATIVTGNATIDVSGPDLNYSPLLLSGGGLVQLARNDDYFSEDSRIIATLGEGVYYVGVAASGNETFDPTIPGSGFGGKTQGKYDLNLKFEPQVDEVDVIRDRDSDRAGVPGTALDGDGDGVPGGVNNFWFQTRPLDRIIEFVNNGAAVTPGQTMQIVSTTGVSRTYEFVPNGQTPRPGNIPVLYVPGPIGSTPATGLAASLASAINARTSETGGVRATVSGTTLTLAGDRSVDLSNNFRAATAFGRTIFVDKTAGPQADGSLARPFNNISNPAVPNAFDATISGDIVRIVGNGGADGNIATEADNFSYRIGVSDTGGITLEDGRNMNVPQGVTTMIDAGAILKLRGARISVGSSSLLEDRSGSALQVLGTPRLVQLSRQGQPVATALIAGNDSLAPGYSDGSVILTSTKDRGADVAAAGSASAPAPGDWGGIVFQRDLDQSEGRADLEDEGIFLQHVNHAQIRYGGSSNLLIDSIQQLVNPIQIFNLRPTISFNEISFSADAAISASPDSFEETSFQTPRFQQAGEFTADYSRVGPAIYDNQLINNSINGLFIRVVTTPGTPPRELTLAGRFDDTDIVHYVAENIVVKGTPGGSIQDGIRPDLASTAFAPISGGRLAAGNYNYRLTFVDANGFESLASDPSGTVTATANSSIRLVNLPPVATDSDYVSRRLYRLNPTTGEYRFVAALDATDSDFVDDGSSSEGVLDLTRAGIRGRLDASLVVDPGTVVKFRGARIELGQSTVLLAEGLQSNPVVFTSYADDRFGAGGTFDTNNDSNSPSGGIVAARGDWSGIYAGATSSVSLDYATIAFGGGVSLLDGGQSRGFAALELQQAEGRITNSRFEFNEDGQDGAGPVGRFGRLNVTPSTIYVRGSQPTIVANQFVDNRGSIIDIDSDSMNAERIVDLGRQTGELDRFAELDDNYGPLVRLNRYQIVPTSVVANRQISGLEIRGGELTTESVWDDTDIVHLLFDSITVGNLHSSGGLRLISRSDESLVVKLTGEGSPFSATSGTGLTATGSLTDIADRIGGSIQVIGQPGAPVVLTSFADDTVGAGLTPQGTAFTDSNGDSFGTRPESNDWRSILFDQYSHDRNFDYILEQTITAENAPGLNGTVSNAQVLGALAPNQVSGDDQLRLGFEVEGFLSEVNDVDTYSFTAEAGTRVWLDVDRTHFNLDTVVEVLDANGNVLARSDNSFAEVAGTPLQDVDNLIAANVRSLQGGNSAFTQFGAGGLYEDFGSTNPRDAGLSLSLPGNPGVRSVYFFRVRSASVNPDDNAGGITKGGYRFQVRLQEAQEFPGNIVRYADIRYANHGVHVRGAQSSSPLLGEAQENEGISAASSNNTITTNAAAPGQRPQYLGNLLFSEDRVFSVGGALASANDIDFYQIDVDGTFAGLQTTSIFDIDYAAGFNRPDTTLYVFYDADGEFGPVQPRLVLMGQDSNVLDDQAKPVSSTALDLLSRGSVSSGDPLVGPISLAEGTYYVAVVGTGRIADALISPTTRREPIEALLRIFDDHVESLGGATALPPREGSLFDETTFTPGWAITTARATDPGHQRTETFNRSRGVAVFPPSVQNEIGVLGGTFATAQNLSVGDPLWSLASDPNIGSATANTSQQIPHTTLVGTTANEIVDIFRIDVPVNASNVILDIDNGFNPLTDPTNLPPGDTPVVDPTSVDLKLQLFDSNFNLLASNSFSLASNGALGSAANSALNLFSNDPFIQTNLVAGTYFIAVSPEATTFDPLTDTFSLDPASRPLSGNYELHVSVENHPNDGALGNESIRFDRSAPTGTITSAPFDLTGYGAKDLPQFYFSYFYRPAFASTDSVTVVARSNENPTGTTLLANADLQVNRLTNEWSQAITSLADFAGHTGIVLEFTYTTDAFSVGGEGLYLDDFIVGFAERGEMVTNAAPGATGITGTSATTPGEYQLEVRPATSYATPTATGLTLSSTFDTNARHVEAVTIVAPHATQINDGDTFTLSDGVRTVRFEFDSSVPQNFVPGNIRIGFSATSTQSQIADAIRTAINLPVVQSTLKIQASDASGSASGGFGDVQIAISGLVLGDFLELSRPSSLPDATQPLDPAGGPFRLPVVFNQGIGDENVERAQSLTIVESNKIRDTHAMGVWSQPGDRLLDPEDPTGFSLQSNPIGSMTPGAVRNLPTLNDEVIGGQAPGIVVRNNTIDHAGMAGVKVDGEMRPFVIDSSSAGAAAATFGDLINDGLVMTIDAGDLRVVFEFDDIGGAVVPAGGSGVNGGDGVTPGHVPVYFRRSDPSPYNGRTDAHTRHEVMRAIFEAINTSILVMNDMSPLVQTTLGTSLLVNDETGGIGIGLLSRNNAAVYVEGATRVAFSGQFQRIAGGNPFNLTGQAPIHEAAQPVARIVNNTIYGSDGTSSRFGGDPRVEPTDLISQAVDTRVGEAQSGPYIRTAAIGDTVGLVGGSADVDLYRVFLDAGDRLTVDIDTLATGPDTTLRLFDSRGVEVLLNRGGGAPDFLETSGNPANFDSAIGRAADPFMDFTARTRGVYYIGVSSAGNEAYDPLTLSGRVEGSGGTGAYSIAVQAYAPRNFVLSFNSDNPLALVGSTFTITQIPNLNGQATNQRTFVFANGGGIGVNGAGQVTIPVTASFFPADLMRSIANAINSIPAGLFNHRSSNGPDGLPGPIDVVNATPLGGSAGNDAGYVSFGNFSDFNSGGFSHDRVGLGINGTSELYVLVERAAEISLGTAGQNGLTLDPTPGLDINQLYPETGVLLTAGSSGTVVNNVLSNLHQGVVLEQSYVLGFTNRGPNVHPKQAIAIVTANVFQHMEPTNNNFRNNMNAPIIGSIGISPGPSNVNGGNDDFNITVGNDGSLFVHPEADNFLPASDSIIIDSSVNSLTERDRITGLRQSIGLSPSNVLAPDRDVNGVLRADNPNVAPPGGLGSQVFKDRGSNELADFVGPVAIIDVPRDNDPQGVDKDPTTSFIRLTSGTYQEFRIQLRDTGDSSDPFAGLGIDDDTVIVAPIEGLRSPGANFTVFEDDRLLVEGIDYTFSYDATQKIITLTPLAGIWQNDRSYRMSLNNKSRAVLVAPNANQVADGDQISVTDASGGTVVFEFETGYQLLVPEALTLVVPQVGTDAGGLRDGDVFSIDDRVNAPVIFEFDSDGVKLPESIRVQLPATGTPRDPAALQAFLAGIATNIATAINSVLDSRLNVDATAVGSRVVLGTEVGTVVTTTGSGLSQPVRTLGLRAPEAGTAIGGVTDGQTFTVSDGNTTITFEIDTNNVINVPTNVAIPLVGVLTGNEVAVEISRVIAQTGLALTPTVNGEVVYLNLPLDGSFTITPGQLTQVGISRTLSDGDLVTFTPTGANAQPVSLEINRTDLPPTVPPVTQGNARIDINRSTTATELATQIASQIRLLAIPGVEPTDVLAIPGGQVSIGGDAALGLEVTPNSNFEIAGTPSVTGVSSIQVFGPLLLNLPLVGGGAIQDGSVLILVDNLGNQEVFEFNLANTLPLDPLVFPGHNVVNYNTFDNVDIFGANLAAAINAANIGITAGVAGTGRVSLGRIDASRVITSGIAEDLTQIPAIPAVPGVPQITTRRGIVSDGERFTIRQGGTSVTFEFESVNNGGGVASGNIPVAFQPGSTPGDVAVSLAAAITNNRGNLVLSPVAEIVDGSPTGQVILNDQPGTVIDVSAAPTLNLVGVPGGAQPILISPTLTAEQIKQRLITAINSVNRPGQAPVTNLAAVDRGGNTFFVENGVLFNGPLVNYFLPAIADITGNPLEPNRQDQTTQFTLLMPTVALDFGDAPDPVGSITGRYPTLFANDGPRHVITSNLSLGLTVDADADGQPSIGADADDLTIVGSTTGSLFTVRLVNGELIIEIDENVSANGFSFPGVEGNTITITTAIATATLEFDTDGIFNEDNFAIRPTDRTNVASIAAAILRAIAESPVRPAMTRLFTEVDPTTNTNVTRGVTVGGNDEDGVIFTSDINPIGAFNKNVETPITVTVVGAGILQGWIDFNVDGDFDDPGEQIIDGTDVRHVFSELFDANGNLVPNAPRTFDVTVPATTPDPLGPITTYARFRISRDGNLLPTGLALSGEVEDYAVTLVPGAPPTISADRVQQTYVGREDTPLQAVSPAVGLLAGVVDPNGDGVAIFGPDTGQRVLRTLDGTNAGTLTLNADGTFQFAPEPDFNGNVSFTARVTDLRPGNPGAQLVNSTPITVTLRVDPVNDPPRLVGSPTISRSVNEDVVITFTPEELFASYVAGPSNELTQPLVIQGAGSSAGVFRSTLGGIIAVSADRRSIVYTPPIDLGGVTDTFTYTVADQPGTGQLSEVASQSATVSISIASINDPPIVNPDSFQTPEGTPLTFTAVELLGNDRPGPTDEVNAGQTISLAPNQFPKTSAQGGTISIQGTGFVYTPPQFFSGVDQFTYTVIDSVGDTNVGTVTVTVGAVNNAPRFIGINGDPLRNSLTFDESKQTAQQPSFNLSTWFNDPDNDQLTFEVTSENVSIVAAAVNGNQLTLTLPPFQFGQTSLTVVARDPSGRDATRVIPITVNNTPDPPTVIGTLNPLGASEDPPNQLVTGNLATVFNDPDRNQLTYSVSRLGSISNPTAAQIAAHPLVQSISFVGDELRIILKPNQSGSVEIEIGATDGSFRVSDTFTLNVAAVPDNPVALPDAYDVPVGATFTVANPSLGLLRNDTDGDGDSFTIDMASVTDTALGTISVNPDGTFTYTNREGEAGDVDQFSYRVVDSTGRFSQTVSVSLTLGASAYQNPIPDLRSDVNADGNISAIDALRIINVLNRLLGPNETSISVSAIGTPPPDYVDVNGDGRVSTADALDVLAVLRMRDNVGESEQLSSTAATASTVTFATASTLNLPTRVSEISSQATSGTTQSGVPGNNSRDRILAAGFEIEQGSENADFDELASENELVASGDSVDEALASLFGEINLLGD